MSIIDHLPTWFQQEGVKVDWAKSIVPVSNGWQLCNLDKKKVTEITYRGSQCTDWICEAIVGWNRETLVKTINLNKPFLLYINTKDLNEQNWRIQKEFLHKMEQRNGLKKTKAFLFKHKLFLIPDKRICQSSVLTSFYTKFIRNLVKQTTILDQPVDFHTNFWKNDVVLQQELLTKIIFSGKLLDISKDIPNPGGLIDVQPSHGNLGIYWNLEVARYPEDNLKRYKHAQNIANLNQQLQEVKLDALPSL